jgi:hypothetical protein
MSKFGIKDDLEKNKVISVEVILVSQTQSPVNLD